jgi:hypothetical protein
MEKVVLTPNERQELESENIAMGIRELLEKELWGDEDATLRGQVNIDALTMLEMEELKAQLTTIGKRLQSLWETIENPKQTKFNFDE